MRKKIQEYKERALMLQIEEAAGVPDPSPLWPRAQTLRALLSLIAKYEKLALTGLNN